MPSPNVLKIDIPESYYHVYARGGSRREIFLDSEDYTFFVNLFQRYLSQKPVSDATGRPYPQLTGKVELLTYCLMPNHFHLLFYQHDEQAVSRLMRGIMTSYSRYFNKKYDRSGALFESRYKASRISSDEYLLHISRYIHLNPKQWQTWRWSSLKYYLTPTGDEWIEPKRILELFSSTEVYATFVTDYEDEQRMRDALKQELANK